jgi:outer membrane protein assembly factor BamA
VFGATLVSLCAGTALAQQPVIAAIQVHGNTLTPDAEVIQASGLIGGTIYSEGLLETAKERLIATGRFQHVDVLKRYASIADASQILVIIQIDDGPVRVVPGGAGQPPHVARRKSATVMFIPVLNAEDGYGITYGAQVAVSGRSAVAPRLVMPVTWGGNKSVGVEFQKEFVSHRAPRVRAGFLAQRRTHPFFHSDADRVQTSLRGDWHIAKPLFVGATGGWQRTTLTGRVDRVRSVGAEITLDTRIDAMLPGNAIYARTRIERMQFASTGMFRSNLEAIGYLALYRGSVLVLRGVHEGATGTLPPFFKSVVGGSDNLRGFRAGTAIGDEMAATSAEVRAPLTSPLRMARLGGSVFIDMAAAYDHGRPVSDQHFMRGVGGGVWATAPLFKLSVMVAHGLGSGTRVHVQAGVTF